MKEAEKARQKRNRTRDLETSQDFPPQLAVSQTHSRHLYVLDFSLDTRSLTLHCEKSPEVLDMLSASAKPQQNGRR